MSKPLRLALVGLGKIAHDQHLPTIAASPDFVLAATVSRHATIEGAPNHTSLEAALAAHPEVEAVVLCTPPQGRHQLARAALEAGRHVFLEKPPATGLAEIENLRALAAEQGLCLYASWHSRAAPGVEPARAWLAGRRIRSAEIAWKEDVRHWHPGQDWIFEPGGMGVFDPGINALSIVTRVLPRPILLRRAILCFPANRQTPIAADLAFEDTHGAPVAAAFDFLQTGRQSWDIRVETDDGELLMSEGGAKLSIGNVAQVLDQTPEYRRLYDRFAALVRAGRSEVDTAPLVLVADAFMLGERRMAAAFAW